MKKAVTIKSIAEQLNISRNTAAKALNGQYVPEKTREAVLNKAREMNYKSLNLNRLEVGNKKYRILLVSGKPLGNMNYFIPLIKGIENFCYEKNYELFQYTYNKSRTPFSVFSDYVKELAADGIVAIECFDREFIIKLLNLGKPVCFNDFTASETAENKRFDLITTNNERSVCDAVRLLHARYKITRFTFVGDGKHCLSFHDRYAGMLKGISAVKGAHSQKEDVLCSDENFDYGDPNSLKTEILKLKYRPECFVCCNDFVARAVCNALKTLGIGVPKDALVIGFDNASESVACKPDISTFSVDREFLGRETMRALTDRIERPDIPSRTITVNASLILRASTDRIK